MNTLCWVRKNFVFRCNSTKFNSHEPIQLWTRFFCRTFRHLLVGVKVSLYVEGTIDRSLNCRKVWNIFYKTIDAFVEDPKVPYFLYRSLHHFIIDVKVSYILYETIDNFVNYTEAWNDFYETLDSFADDLKVCYYLCGTFQHFWSALRFRKMLTKPLLLSFTNQRFPIIFMELFALSTLPLGFVKCWWNQCAFPTLFEGFIAFCN